MKNIYKILIAFIGILVVSCNADDVENRPVIEPVLAPVLLTPQNDFNIILTKENENEVATTVIWEDAKYDGTQTVVNYTIEIAKAGTDFAAPTAVTTTTEHYRALTVMELNSALVNGGFIEKQENSVDIRIKATVGIGSEAQYSNFHTFKATPYHTPLASSHWLVGAATPGGWTWDGDAETEFPLVSGKTDVYKVTVVLTQNAAFREFLGNNFTSSGNWDASHNYTYYSSNGFTIDPELINAGDGDSNFQYTGPTGERTLTIDNTAKTITLE
ncbi:SusE domain-containing protein [Flavobacterium sp. 5]|uniref:SusE domain-containing protein n=1 Tax=Flavobacterium sp. 5 TaxID=2035199 RepID=UPI000C2CDA00|nr:SusE domain-containing protein [Flavobacterium sp. 5]PKB17084.1 SusE-like outer membrane protein [Flavobacterium sp. 5]